MNMELTEIGSPRKSYYDESHPDYLKRKITWLEDRLISIEEDFRDELQKFKEDTLWNRIKSFFLNKHLEFISFYCQVKLKLQTKLQPYRVKFQRRCFKVYIKKAHLERKKEPFNDYCRIVYCCTPNWIGKLFGYQEFTQGYVGRPGDWFRMVGFAYGSMPISKNFQAKQLDPVHRKLKIDSFFG